MGLFSKKKSSSPSQSADAIPTAPLADLSLPEEFNVWYKDIPLSVTVYIGHYEDKHTKETLYEGIYPKSWFGPLFIRSGPSSEFPVALKMKHTSWTLSEACVEYQGSLAAEEGQTPCRETIRYHMSRKSERYWFATQINNQVEKFEWRRSTGVEAKSLEGFGDCWKLARIGPPRSGDSDGAQQPVPSEDFGTTSDGKEIVAVTAFRKRLKTVGKIRYMNSGERDGLGLQFKWMVLMSHLLIYHKHDLHEFDWLTSLHSSLLVWV